jgi:hypothetical protein
VDEATVGLEVCADALKVGVIDSSGNMRVYRVEVDDWVLLTGWRFLAERHGDEAHRAQCWGGYPWSSRVKDKDRESDFEQRRRAYQEELVIQGGK